MIFVDAQQFNVEGRGWTATQAPYDRLPAHAQDRVREPVWNLSHHAAGLHVRFVTDAETIRVRWVLTNPWLYLPNMAATGVSGVDLYVRTDDRQWRWLAVGQPTAQTNSVVIVDNLTAGKREYLLYFPLHNGVQSLEIGVPDSATLTKAALGEPARASPSFSTALPSNRGSAPQERAWCIAPSLVAASTGRPSTWGSPVRVKWNPNWRTCSPSSIRRSTSLRLPAQPQCRRSEGTRGTVRADIAQSASGRADRARGGSSHAGCVLRRGTTRSSCGASVRS